MSKKRKRDIADVDLSLAEIYEHLADYRESTRLAAAKRLIYKATNSEETGQAQIREIFIRLFRGLCSSRKAARLGFSLALTELLCQISTTGNDASISTAAIVQLLKSKTKPDSNTSSQDERDHYIGRLFGIQALLRSGVLYHAENSDQFKDVLESLCDIARRKPWLRQECGWALFTSVAPTSAPEKHAVAMLEILSSQKLVRTPEGVAIWLAVAENWPNAGLPKHVWKHDDPLHVASLSLLAEVLKDARGQSEEDEFRAQGAAMWAPTLHFVWDIVLAGLYEGSQHHSERRSKKPSKKSKAMISGGSPTRASCESFWSIVVDDGLFGASSSTERKHWGLLLWSKVLETAPAQLLPSTLSKNAMQCMLNSLKDDESHLRKSALKLTHLILSRIEEDADSHHTAILASQFIKAVLQATNFQDFDHVTQTKIIQGMMNAKGDTVARSIDAALWELLDPFLKDSDSKEALAPTRNILNLQGKLFSAQLNEALNSNSDSGLLWSSTSMPLQMLRKWLGIMQTDQVSRTVDREEKITIASNSKTLIKERLEACFEYALRSSRLGAHLFEKTVASTIRAGAETNVQMDEQIQELVTAAWQRLDQWPVLVPGTTIDEHPSRRNVLNFSEGLALLSHLVLYQVYNGETEAVEILQDVITSLDRLKSASGDESGTSEGDFSTDTLVEILLSLTSRPSKFVRRLTLLIFQAFAPRTTSAGLQSLVRILSTRENVEGQQDMFQAEEVDEDFDEGDEGDSDIEMDSDVEVESGEESSAEEEEENGVDEEDDTDESETDDELAAFDAALVSALGTRRGQDDLGADDTSGSSDSDMDDDQMMNLDAKIAEIFTARQQKTSKKKVDKDAKENIVHFKNRVLDFVDAYLTRQSLNPISVELILPLLTTARTSRTKQVANRACDILQSYCSRCKGKKVPLIKRGGENGLHEVIELLKAVHVEAGMRGPNTHKAVASKASILLVKIFVKAGGDLAVAEKVYAETKLRREMDKKCKVRPDFFADWDNWCSSWKSRRGTN